MERRASALLSFLTFHSVHSVPKQQTRAPLAVLVLVDSQLQLHPEFVFYVVRNRHGQAHKMVVLPATAL